MSKRLLRFSKVEEVDQDGMPDGEWFVYLWSGWAFDDAQENPADDSEGRSASHARGGEVDYLVERIRGAKPCRCGRCVRLMAEEDPELLTGAELAWVKANPEVQS